MADTYGQYKPQAPISSRLKVSGGTNKPHRARMQKLNRDFQPLGNIQRGSRENTLWVKKKSQLGTVIPNASYEADEVAIGNEATDDAYAEVVEMLDDAVEYGELSAQEADDVLTVIDGFAAGNDCIVGSE